MVSLAVQPVQSTNILNALQNSLNQWAAMHAMHQRNQLADWQNKLSGAKLGLLQQQKQASPLPLSSFGKLVHDRGLAETQFGVNSQEMKTFDAAIQKAAAQTTGLQVYGPNGQLLVSQGAPTQPFSNFFKNPLMGSARSGSGGTYINPQTGQTVSTDTTPMATSDQSAISAVDRVTPQMTNILQTLPPFQSGWKNMLTNMQGFSNRWLGSNYGGPSIRASGLASLETAPEALLKAYGLRPSEYALRVMKETIKPRSGETSAGYQQRIGDTLNQLGDFKGQSKAHLRQGIDVTKNEENDPIAAEINRRKQVGQWP